MVEFGVCLNSIACILFCTRKEKMKCFGFTWIKNTIVYNTLLIRYFEVRGY